MLVQLIRSYLEQLLCKIKPVIISFFRIHIFNKRLKFNEIIVYVYHSIGTTDFIIIPNPSQNGAVLTSGSDRFCGLGIAATTSKSKII